MRITANQLTSVRILLIPLPTALILLGNRDMQFVALALYIVVGMTDFFDGMLARKYGTTKLGALLDPIADKIYTALLYIPLSLLGWLPHWMIVAILLRDPVITCLRSLCTMRGIPMKTAKLAQYKTAIQMIAGGYIIWVCLVADKRSAITGMLIGFGLCMLWFFIYTGMRRRLSPRLVTLVGLVFLAALIRYFFSWQHTAFIYGAVIMAMTWIAGLNYFIKLALKFSAGTGKVLPQWWVFYFLESLVLALAILVLQGESRVPLWVPMVVLSIEFAVGALDNIITSDGALRTSSGTGLKLMFQYVIIGLIFLKLWYPDALPSSLNHALWVDAYFLVGVTLLAFIFFFARHGVKIIMGKS
ncbi:MAG: CDP-alcohol phosphatidyltransferase family protein [Pseudomonadota bacterium]